MASGTTLPAHDADCDLEDGSATPRRSQQATRTIATDDGAVAEPANSRLARLHGADRRREIGTGSYDEPDAG